MSATYPVQATFGKGEITPLAYGRVDMDFFKQSCELCRNFAVMLHGGLRRRSGTRFVAPVADEDFFSRLFPFSFSNDQSYVLDVSGGGNVQFLAERGYVGAPYTVSHPWAESVLDLLTYTQFNDVAYFANRANAPQVLSRFADTNWTLGNMVLSDGPYMPGVSSTTTLTPAATGGVVPYMTANALPVPFVATSTSGAADSYKPFDGFSDTEVQFAADSVGFVQIDLGSPKVVDNYWLQTLSINMPSAWMFEGSNDGSTYTILDRVEGETGWTSSERRYFETDNKATFRYYRFTFSGGGANSRIARIELHHIAAHQTAFNLTASAVTGINSSTGFQTSDVGRAIHLVGTDGVGRWAEIIARTSTTVVTIRLHGQSLPDLQPVKSWSLGAFSASSGFPALVELYDERLNFGRTDSQPVTIWGSKQGSFSDFGASDPILPTDGYSLTFLTSNMNELVWISADEDLVTGSAKQIRSLSPADTTQAFSATNLTQRKGPSSGADRVQPLNIGGTLLYIAAGAKKIRELVLGDQNRYVAPEMSLLGEHVLNSGIAWWTFSENPEPTIYAGTEDGSVVSILYDREQRAVGFAVYESGFAESGALIPSQTPGYDDLYLVMRRTINGAQRRYVEVLERPFHYENDVVLVDGRPTGSDGFFVDCGLTYSGPPAMTISGLGHLEGQAVIALADGSVVENLTVTAGAITLPYMASTVHIGLAYESEVRTHRFTGPGQDGFLFGRRVTQTAVYVDLLSTGSLQVGAYGDENWTPDTFEVNPHAGDAFTGNPVELISGVHRCDIEGSWGVGNGQIVLKTDAPLPCIIRLLQLSAEYEP
jgi:hypothetical protein